jgi:hypothetical protein
VAYSPANVFGLNISLVVISHTDPELVIDVWSRADDLLIPELGAQQLTQFGTRLAIVEPFRRGPDGPGGIGMLRLLVLEERKKLGIGPAGGRPFRW